MTIKEAIELLQKDIDKPGSIYPCDREKVERFGLEALKRQDIIRSRFSRADWHLLPGETD